MTSASYASLAPVLPAQGIVGPDDLDIGGRMTAMQDQARPLNSQLIGLTTVAGWVTKRPTE
jgi:hypothetical protein